jgi:hypothetical protein
MYCYKFPSRTQFRTLAAAEGLVVDNELLTASHTHAIDEIGVIYEGGTYDAEGVVITPPTALRGWHVNTLGIAPEAWGEFIVAPANPYRVFA